MECNNNRLILGNESIKNIRKIDMIFSVLKLRKEMYVTG